LPKQALPPLARALTLRVIVLLLAVVMLTLVSISVFVVWQGKQERIEENLAATQMVSTRLKLLQSSWQQAAENITTGIELQRITSLPETIRWQRLRAWLVALGENLGFDTVLVQDKNGRVLFAHGHEGDEISAMPPAKTERWYFSYLQKEFHAVIRLPLWLGPDAGRGEIVFLRAIQPSTLQLIGSDIRPLYLASADALLAGSDDAKIPINPGAEFKLADKRWRILAAPVDGARDVRFLLRLSAEPPTWFQPVLIGAFALGLMLAIGIYLVLGRWARGLVRRIETLGQAARTFGHDQNPALEPARLLLSSVQETRDEVGDVAEILETLMHTVHLREEQSRAYLDTLNLLEEVVIELDLDGVIRRASAACPRLSGYTVAEATSAEKELPPVYFKDRLHPDDAEQMATVLGAIASHEKEQITLRARLRGEGISDTWVECRFVALRDGANHVLGVRGVLRDVTQTYLQEKQITHMALHDALTGLPNRVLLEDRAKMAIRIAKRAEHKVGLCFFDLDHFKQINDTLGHKAGDRLLIALSEAVRDRLRGGDTLARWGGDEFVLLIPDMKSVDDIRDVITKVAKITNTPLTVDGADFAVTFSMGVTIYPDDADNIDALLSQADRAMFYAKAQGRNTFQFYGDMSQKGLGKKDLYIQHRLAAAIKAGEIRTWFQPLIDAATGRTVGLEALARWHDPELGWVSPASFIPMAENLGLIRELGEQVWTATLTAGQTWKARGHDLNLAVNLSKRQLFMPYFTEKLLEDAARFGVAPQSITLEITESIALLDVEFASERLNELSRAGFRIAIDDFGTGYSSLSQLHDMPVHEIKIDISFVRRINTPQGLRVIQAIIQMAAAMHLECVAEGVEDAETAALLASIGVNTLQGFHFAKPMPAEEFDAWLNARTNPG
jgi:diguanylate cyclase (GGDEF)-like protein/PAS domain S-box-containing protein